MLNNRYIYAGVGMLYAVLIVALIAAKLAGHLHWGWWWILTPFWAPVVLVVLAALAAIIGLVGAQSRGENPFQ